MFYVLTYFKTEVAFAWSLWTITVFNVAVFNKFFSNIKNAIVTSLVSNKNNI